LLGEEEESTALDMVSDYDLFSIQMAGVGEGETVFLIGVRSEILAPYIARVWNASVISVVTSNKLLNEVKRRINEGGLKRRVCILKAEPVSLPLREESLGVTISMGGMEQFSAQTVLQSLREIRRVLRKQGRLVLVEDWAYDPKNEIEYMALELRNKVAEEEGKNEPLLNYRDYLQLLKKAGFGVKEIRFLSRRLSREMLLRLQEARPRELLEIVQSQGSIILQTRMTLISSIVKR